MASGIVRQEPRINEVLRINSCTRGITKVKFGYSQLYAIMEEERLVAQVLKFKGG